MESFVINHKRYEAGTTFQVTTPELGTLVAPVETVQQLATVGAAGLRLGPITTPLPCRSGSHPQHNAYLHFYALSDYLRLQLIYTCTCPYEYHNHSLEWDVLFNKTTIVATKIGSYFSQPHRHPMALGFEELAPTPYVVPEPPPLPIRHPAKEMQRDCKEGGLPASVAPSLAEPVAESPEPANELPGPNVSRHGQFTLF